jgi:hypothetical protein
MHCSKFPGHKNNRAAAASIAHIRAGSVAWRGTARDEHADAGDESHETS